MSNNQKHYYQNDTWSLDDDFSMGKVGDEVAQMVLQVSAPFTIGITGKWCSGKTSVLRRAYMTLGGVPIQQDRELADQISELSEEECKTWEKMSAENRCHLVVGNPNKLNWSNDISSNITNKLKATRCIWFSPWQHQNEANPIVPLLREIRSQFSW